MSFSYHARRTGKILAAKILPNTYPWPAHSALNSQWTSLKWKDQLIYIFRKELRKIGL
ncbi:hypothetical protein K06K5_52480 (plasmid) [Vibrio alginolyticus]|nr:hypothetical protein K06K5_52480 [Vibrio alginolyticus]